jgi:precorrin-6B methylase 2
MRALITTVAAIWIGCTAAAQEAPTPVEAAARIERDANASYRYRAAIASLLQLKPGMVAAEAGATSGYIARAMAAQLTSGRVIASTFDPAMAAYMRQRAAADAVQNFTVVTAQPGSTALDPASVDAIAIVDAFGTAPRQADLMASLAAALKPGGALLVVDLPQESVGGKVTGIEADDVVALAAAAGLAREAESGIVPGHYAIRFRKTASQQP